MKHWSRSLALLALLLGSLGEGGAIASTESPVNLSRQDSRLNIAPTQLSFQLAQFNNGLGQRGECRAVKRETPIYSANSIRAITGFFLNTNDIVYLWENNRNGQRLIAVSDLQQNFLGYIETSELKFCPPIVTRPQTTFPQTTFPQRTLPQTTFPQTTFPQTTLPQRTLPQRTLPQTTFPQTTLPSQFPLSLNRCEIIRETNLHDSPGFDSRKRKFLEISERVEVDPQKIGTANNFQWLYISTTLGDSGWVISDSIGCR